MKRFRDPRTGPFESALRRGTTGEVDALLRDRHTYWAQEVDEPEVQNDGEPEGGETRQKQSKRLIFWLTLYFIWLSFALYRSLGPIAILYVSALVLLLLLIYGMFSVFGIRAEQKLRVSSLIPEIQKDRSRYQEMMKGRCLQCGYELTGCRDEIEVVPEGSLGPRRCPECAAYWPLVPEPTPEEMHKWHRSWFQR